MTGEEAIEWLIQIKDKYIHDGDEQFDAKRKEALGMAIEALKSDRPKGEWINRSLNILYPAFERYTCSVCGEHSYSYDFCPNCGADMRGEQDG